MVNWKDPWHPEAGGAEAYAWRMARHLLSAGALVTYVTARPSAQARDDNRDGVPIVRGGGRWTVYPWVLWWLWRHRRDFDAVIDCQNGIPFFSPWVLPRRTAIVCVIHHVHDRQFELHFGPLLARIGQWLEGPVARRAYRRAVTVAVSPSTVTALRERLGWQGPVVVIPNGMESSGGTGSEVSARAEAPALLCVGRLAVHKRVERLLDVVEDLGERWPGLRLDVVGNGPVLPALRATVAERGLADRVILHGFLPTAERDELVSRAWLHLSASHGEGWGLVVLEAARAGLPTVAYDVDGLRDAVLHGETGWLAPHDGDFTTAVDEALTVLADPDRAATTAAACRRWAAGFSWDGSGERMRAVLDDLLAPGAVPWSEQSVVAVAVVADPPAVAERLRAALPERCRVDAEAGSLRLLAPAVPAEALLTALAAAGISRESVTVRTPLPTELLGGGAA